MGQIIGLVGTLLGIPVAIAAYYRGVRGLTHLIGVRSFLSMRRSEQVDVIVTTSTELTSDTGQRYTRPLTGLGQVYGMGIAAEALGQYYPKKPMSPRMSVHPGPRSNDLVLLGGVSNNRQSADYLEELRKAFPTLRLEFDDVGCRLAVSGGPSRTMGDYECADFDFKFVGEGERRYPAEDLGLIVFWKNPWVDDWRRGVLCAGFSTYGTAGAVDYLFNRVLKKAGLIHQSSFARGGHRVQHRPNFVAVVRVVVEKYQVVSSKLLTAKPLS